MFEFPEKFQGGPFYVKKFFISYLACILCVYFLGLKDDKFQVSKKPEIMNFLRKKCPKTAENAKF